MKVLIMNILRSGIMFSLVLISLDVSAKGRPATQQDGLWVFFTIVETAEKTRPGLGVQLLEEAVGLQSDEAVRLYNHIIASMAEISRTARSLTNDLCIEMKTHPVFEVDEFADRVESVNSRVSELRTARLSEIPLAYAYSSDLIHEFVAKNVTPGVKILSSVTREHKRDPRIEVSTRLERLCKPPQPFSSHSN